ncbi:MAG: hypothetical protein AB7U45_09800 [Desulfamplus sp.]
MEQETCSHEEKGGQAQSMPQDTASYAQNTQGNKPSEPDCGEQNSYAYQGVKYEQPNQMNMGNQPPQQPMVNPNTSSVHNSAGTHHPEMQYSYQGIQQPNPGMQPPPYQAPYQGFQQVYPGGVPQPQPHSAGVQQPPPPHQSSGHKKQGQSHCSCGNHQQYGTPPAGHVTEMMGRFMSGNVTPEDVNAVGGYFGIDCQSTRFWTGIILGAAGALLLSRSFKSE